MKVTKGELKTLIQLYEVYDDVDYLYKAQSIALKEEEEDIFELITLEIFVRGFIESINKKRGYIVDLMEKLKVAASKKDNEPEIEYLELLLEHFVAKYEELNKDFSFWRLNRP